MSKSVFTDWVASIRRYMSQPYDYISQECRDVSTDVAYPSWMIFADPCYFLRRSLQFCLRSCVRVLRGSPENLALGPKRQKLTSGDRWFKNSLRARAAAR